MLRNYTTGTRDLPAYSMDDLRAAAKRIEAMPRHLSAFKGTMDQFRFECAIQGVIEGPLGLPGLADMPVCQVGNSVIVADRRVMEEILRGDPGAIKAVRKIVPDFDPFVPEEAPT